MKLFLVTYDLRAPGQDYGSLWSALTSLQARRALESVWILKGPYSCTQVRDHLRQFIDANDRLLVVEPSEWAGWHLMFDINGL